MARASASVAILPKRKFMKKTTGDYHRRTRRCSDSSLSNPGRHQAAHHRAPIFSTIPYWRIAERRMRQLYPHSILRRSSRRNYPVKYGVNVFNPRARHSGWSEEALSRQPTLRCRRPPGWLCGAASTRSCLMRPSNAVKTEFMQCEAVAPIQENGPGPPAWRFELPAAPWEITVSVLADCLGRGVFLANRGITGPKVKGSYNQIGIFSQNRRHDFEFPGSEPSQSAGNTRIFYKQRDHRA